MSGSAAPFLTLEDVTVHLHDGRAFRHVHWQIQSDQQWAVVGPNGGGKSTLMKALCGQVPVSGGKIVYHFSRNGRPPQAQMAYVAFEAQTQIAGREGLYHQARWNSGIDHEALPVADYLSEQRVKGLNPYLIPTQVVEEQPDPRDFQADRERVVELLGIEALLDRSLWQVSNGERRKVMLAWALLKGAQLLILDNPFTGLDAASRARLAEIAGRLMQGGKRVVVVTNDPEEIPPGISHVLVVGQGEIVAQGRREEVLDAFLPALGGASPGGGAWTVVHAEQAEKQQEETVVHAEQAEKQQEETVVHAERPEKQQGETDGGVAGRVLVQMEQVRVAYGGVQILDGIDWTVRQGEQWALLGPNGAGKTTLLSLILGDNPQAYANRIWLFGRRRGSGESIWEIKRRIGWVAPELHLTYPRSLSCLDVVCSGFTDSVGFYQRPSPGQREGARRWMERLGVSQYAARAFRELSEGEQRLVLIARALVRGPELLVLDEPCQGLDARHRDRVVQAVAAIGRQGEASMIYVTHDLQALPTTVSHVLRLEQGRIVAWGRWGGVANLV